jgi:uncharacterized protein YkwD
MRYFIIVLVLTLILIPTVCSASIESNINSYRASVGLSKLKIEKQLQETANFKAGDMIFWKYYSHVNPFGARLRDILIKFGINPYTHLSGEIIAYKYTVNNVTKAWLESPAHKDLIIEKKFTKIGCAKQLNYIVCHFTN